MISTYCNVAPEDISFETGCYGKPNAKHLNVKFNISHSEEVVVCAIYAVRKTVSRVQYPRSIRHSLKRAAEPV